MNYFIFQPGISTETLLLLRGLLQESPEKDRAVTLMFDGMHLGPNVQYHHSADQIGGVEDMGNGDRKNCFAKGLLVFMLRSIFGGWCQVIGHHFHGPNFGKGRMEKLLMDYLSALHAAGIECRAIVCDQEPSHVSLFKSLGVTRLTPYIRNPFSGTRTYLIYDAPHLIKNARNNLMQNDFLVSIYLARN